MSVSMETNKKSGILDITPKVCQLKDRFGNTFHYGNAGDFWFPPFPIGADTDYRTHVRKIRNMDIRDDDVIIASFPRSGSHWHVALVSMLMRGRAEYRPDTEVASFLDNLPMEHVEALPSPRILWSNVPFRHLPKKIWEKKVKVVHLVRNPKDVFVSLYNLLHSTVDYMCYDGSFEEFLTLSLECGYYHGDQFDHLMEFQEGIDANPQVQVFTSVFEEMIKDPLTNVERLNDYLGTGCSKEVCKDIVEACQFNKLKPYMDSTADPRLKTLFKDPEGSFYRKGVTGDWKNWFTPTLLEMYEGEYKKRMAEYRICFS